MKTISYSHMIDMKLFKIKERVGLMQKVYVKFDDVEQVREFISIVDKFDVHFAMGSEPHTVDAKSVIGVFALDLTKPQMLSYDSDDQYILERITPFLAAE